MNFTCGLSPNQEINKFLMQNFKVYIILNNVKSHQKLGSYLSIRGFIKAIIYYIDNHLEISQLYSTKNNGLKPVQRGI